RRRRARSRRLPVEMEGGGRDRVDLVRRPVHRLCGGGALPPRLGADAELARRRRHVYDVGRGGLCGDARLRLQRDGFRQGCARAGWADSEAVVRAYLIGMILAGTVGKDHILIRRLRTLTFGFLTPFYFIRAGAFVSVPDLVAAPAAFLLFLAVKIATKMAGVYPVTRGFGQPRKEGMYTTLLMSTGLTFGP